MARTTFITLCLIITGFLTFNTFAGEAYDNREIAYMIRSDKFDYVLPKAMRNNNIDMWIIIDKGRGTEPLFQDFGDATSNGNGILIFTDRGGDRIERAALYWQRNTLPKSGIYDIFGRPEDLKSFVAARNPKRIGINMTTAKELFPPVGRHLGDGLSHTDYINLKKELDEPFASRLVSAERLISDFRSERVASEIVEFAKIANITRKLEEQALSNEIITPGKTTLDDVNRWLEEQVHALGLQRGWWYGVFMSLPDGTEINEQYRVIQPGDVIQTDWGAGRNNFFTDIKRFAYILKENETDALIEQINSLDWIKNITRHDKNLSLTMDRGERRIPELIHVAQKNEVEVTCVHLRKPSLEDVFLHFTGRTIREEEASQAERNKEILRKSFGRRR